MQRKAFVWGMASGMALYGFLSLIGFLVARLTGSGFSTGYALSVILIYVSNAPAILGNGIYMALNRSATSLFNSNLGFFHPALIALNIFGWGIIGIIFGLISTLFRKHGPSPTGD